MDLILVIVLILDEHAELRREKRHRTVRANDSIVMPVALPQESGTIEFDPRYIWYPPSPPLTLLVTFGPQTLVLSWAMPKADLQRIVWRSTEWWWLAIYELIGVLLWFLMGSISDRNQPALYRWCFALVIIRIGSGGCRFTDLETRPSRPSSSWLGATVWFIAESLWWLTRRVRSHSQRAA